MLKAIAQIEASAVALAPEFDVVEEAKPYVRRVFLDRFRPERIVEDTAAVGREFVQLLRDTPSVLREFGRVATGGGIRVTVEQERMPEMLSAGNRIANRLAFALVLGASLVGSAILAAAKIPPTWHGISLLGIGGFVAAMVMSAWLLGSILRHGRL
jgi:ubiquinone biosynthesis protein